MNMQMMRQDAFHARLRDQVRNEVTAAIRAGDEDQAFGVVTTLASLLAEAIGMARNCDEYFVDDCFMAIGQNLDAEVELAQPLAWPRLFISSTQVAS